MARSSRFYPRLWLRALLGVVTRAPIFLAAVRTLRTPHGSCSPHRTHPAEKARHAIGPRKDRRAPSLPHVAPFTGLPCR